MEADMAPKSTTKASDDEKVDVKATNTDVNVSTETIDGPSVEDARDGTTKEQNRLDQNIPSGRANDFDPEKMGLDPVPYGKAKK
jgi:hypothetical protein